MTLSHHFALAFVCLVLGVCIGSFLNVCIHRIPAGISLLHPRSRCPSCCRAIRARDNVPVLSWLWLRGKCRDCRATISPRYVLVELTVGVLFAGSYVAEVAFARGDLWDVLGVLGVSLLTLVLWALISLVVVLALISREGRAVSGRLARGRGIGGKEQALARFELAAAGEPILIQLGDLAGAARVAQAIARDTAERLVVADDVDRLGTRCFEPARPRT
jgi:leader peptidase (prepilin peptidase)/N-methyltransferase